MSIKTTIIGGGARGRWQQTLILLSIAAFIVLSFSITAAAPAAQTQAAGGLGVGSGQGQETGINLTAINQIKADIGKGIYDRPCTAAEHDPTKWHTLVNIQAKCHYDHIHADDPNYVNDIFGTPGAWFGKAGQEISYPWQTFKATSKYEPNTAFVANKQMENDLKHEGYIWVVRRDQPCPNGNCVRDFRLQTHAIFGAHDMPVRFHSFSLEARVCLNGNDLKTCGIVRYGGWIDMGRLFTTAPGVISCSHDVNAVFIPLPADNQFIVDGDPDARDEIRCHPMITNLPAYPSQRPLAEWWGFAGGETRFQLRSYDPIGNVNVQDPAKWEFFCAQTDMNCKYDASIFSAFIGYTLQIFGTTSGTTGLPLDRNGDKRTDFVGYFDRWGGYKPDCTAPALDCVPYNYDNVPFNLYNNTEARYVHTVNESAPRFDHDISPAGQRWITWFYRYAAGHNMTPTPVAPTPTPVVPTATPTPVTPEPVTPTAVPPTANPTNPSVRIDLSAVTANVGETVTASLNLFNVNNLYGLQAQCATDPNVLFGAQVLDGDLFVNSVNSFFVNNGFQPDGKWIVAASRLQPATPISGNGIAFKLSYTVMNTSGSAVNCAVLGVDANGNEIPLEVVNATFNGGGTNPVTPTVEVPTATPVTPTPTATVVEPTPAETLPPETLSVINGTVSYQNRPNNSGISIELLSNGSVIAALATNENGAFTFTDVPVGEYIVVASAPSHLKIGFTVSVTADGQTIQLNAATLPAGDTDDNGMVDVSDASLIGANFGIAAPPAPAGADLNLDATVNIRDLVLVGGNYGKTGPIAGQ